MNLSKIPSQAERRDTSRSTRRRALALSLAALLAWPGVCAAHGTHAGELRIEHPYAHEMLPGAAATAVYFKGIGNSGKTPDRLLGARTPAAGRVELHRMVLEGGVMRMRQLPAIEIPAGAEVAMVPGSSDGYHLMLFELARPLKAGDRFPVTLRFERAGEVEAEVRVQGPRSGHMHH